MKNIVAVGFDMDYTLAQYKPETFEALAYEGTVKKLVHDLGYPSELLNWTFDWKYMVRGLILDKKRGNILKIDHHKYVKVAYHGFREMSKEEKAGTYGNTLTRDSFDEPDYALIDTLFSLAEAYLFAQLVDFIDNNPGKVPNGTDYARMYRDVRAAVDLCHCDGTLKRMVSKDPSRYINDDAPLVPMLKVLRDSGRSTFLLTNSLWDYTNIVMNFLCRTQASNSGTSPSFDWLQYFDVVISGSAKPGFFLEENRANLFEVAPESGMLLNTDNGAKALSRYTEMVDYVIRTQAEKLQQGSELARVRLKEMDLPDAIISLEGNASLPEELKDDVEAVQISGGPAGLEAEIQQLRDLRRGNQKLLVQTEEMLQKETQEDGQFRSQFGTRWTRPQSSTLTKNLLDRPNRFAANLKQAADSDGKIELSVKEHSALMSILDRRSIEAALPTLPKPMMSLDANEDAIVEALKQSLGHGTLCVSLVNRRGLFFAADGRSMHHDPVTKQMVISRDDAKKIHVIGGMLISASGYSCILDYVLFVLKPKIKRGISCEDCAHAAFKILKNEARILLAKLRLQVPKAEDDYGCSLLIGAYEHNRSRLFAVEESVHEIEYSEGYWDIGVGNDIVAEVAYGRKNGFVLEEGPRLALSETEDLIRFLLTCMKETSAREESVGGNIQVYHKPPHKRAQLVFEGGVEHIWFTLKELKAKLYMRQLNMRQLKERQPWRSLVRAATQRLKSVSRRPMKRVKKNKANEV